MVVASAMAFIAVMLVGDDLVPLVLGTAYVVVGDSLPPLTLLLVAMAICSVGRLAALVADRPGLSEMAAGAELAAFWSLGPVLASRYGTTGMAWAAARALGLSLVVLPLALVRGGLAWNVGLLIVASAAYATLLLWMGVVSIGELRSLRSVVRR
jgi:hypothetical protein